MSGVATNKDAYTLCLPGPNINNLYRMVIGASLLRISQYNVSCPQLRTALFAFDWKLHHNAILSLAHPRCAYTRSTTALAFMYIYMALAVLYHVGTQAGSQSTL